MKITQIRLGVLFVALLILVSAHAATTCIVNKKSGQFTDASSSLDATEAHEACAGQISLDLLASFADAESSVEASGTKVLGGVIVTNRNDVAQTVGSTLRASQARIAEPITWEILESDVTLQRTFERWRVAANWDVKWIDVPEIRNPGYIKLPVHNFLAAADYVLGKAKASLKAAGIDISITAYPDRVLEISKEVKK